MTDQPSDASRFRVLMDHIVAGDPHAALALDDLLSRGIRSFLARELPRTQDVEDELRKVLSIVVDAIERREICEPERLLGYVVSVVRHRLATRRRDVVSLKQNIDISDVQVGPEKEIDAADKERKRVAKRVLQALTDKDREALIRFYVRNQSPEEICQDLGLTETQFRHLKQKAKAQRAGR